MTKAAATFYLFRDKKREVRWKLVHRNGRIIACSGEGYRRRIDALNGIRSVKRNCKNAGIVDET